MKTYVLLATAVGASLLLAQTSFSQTTSYSSTTTEDARGTTSNPHAIVNNSLPTGAGVGTSNPSQWGRANAVYTEHEIAKAKADGKDVTGAQTQYRMGLTALNNGLNKEAAQHFDEALRWSEFSPKHRGKTQAKLCRATQLCPAILIRSV